VKEEDLLENVGSSKGSHPDVVVRSKTRVFDNFFKIDKLVVSHRKFDGTMSEDKTRLIFERGDSVGALIYNRDTNQVVLVEEFKAPTLDKGRGRGWIAETMAGTIRAGETPEQAVCREAMEETGYVLTDPELIGCFFSSPGGTSERIFLYFAAVKESDKRGMGGGNPREGEDIRIVYTTPDTLFELLEKREIEDPKLLIATYHLRDRLKRQPPKVAPLSADTIIFRSRTNPAHCIGIKTGEIRLVRGVDLWVNSENTDMMMDRVIGKTISANIRYLGAEKDDEGNVFEDTVANDLKRRIGRRGFVRLGTVVETESGALSEFGVKRIIHIAAVEGQGPGAGVKADPRRIADCVTKVLNYADSRNRSFKLFGSTFKSILIPMLGAGDGGLTSEQVAPCIVDAAANFHADRPETQLGEIYILAYTARDRAAIEQAIAARGTYVQE
jgi:nudix-type nucleoside diphosphatase (YffH/AdpP family)